MSVIKPREIYIHSDTDAEVDNGIDFRVAAKFRQELHQLERESSAPIIIHMQTIGGDWSDGLSIYDVIAFSNCPITMICHGNISSMGTVIMQAAPVRYLMPNCDLMVHFGTSSMDGMHLAVESNAEYLKRIKIQLIDIYAERCINGEYFKDSTEIKVKNFLHRQMEHKVDWYLTPQDAVLYGFADKILTKDEYLNVRQIKKRNTRRTKRCVA